MRPKIVCTQCGSALTQKDVLCPSCGVAVDWADTVTTVEHASQKDAPKKEIRENKSQSKNISAAWSSKSFLGAIAVIALAIVAYAVLIEKRTGVDVVQQHASQPINAQLQFPTVIQELENSVAANPDDMSLTLQLANSLHDGLFYEKAIPYYKTYLMMNPKDANARVDMGICYKELGNFTEAENEMKTALRYVPNHLNAHFNLGIVYLSEGNLQESNTWFKKTVALDPGSEVGKRAQQLLTQHNSQSVKQ
ncbi:MAG: tetratricopeptide repeat protein [Bacteroidota bacterium]|jgi:superkiller protein 3